VIAAVVSSYRAGTVAILERENPQMGREIQIKLSGVSNAVVETMRLHPNKQETGEPTPKHAATAPQEVVVRQPGLLILRWILP